MNIIVVHDLLLKELTRLLAEERSDVPMRYHRRDAYDIIDKIAPPQWPPIPDNPGLEAD